MRYLLLALTTLFLLPKLTPVFAVTTTILEPPPHIGDEPFKVTVQVEGASAGTNYLRVDLYQDGTKNYFGETDNTQAWYGGSDGKQYYPITITTGVPTVATVSARIGDPSQTDYPGPGEYKMRVRRYTSSGNQGSEDPHSVDITLTKSWPTPTPSPSPTQAPTPTATPTSTPSPTEASTPTPIASVKPLPSPSLAQSPVGTVAGDTTEINLESYGLTKTQASPSATPSATLKLNSRRAQHATITGLGLTLLSAAGYLGYKRYQKTQK